LELLLMLLLLMLLLLLLLCSKPSLESACSTSLFHWLQADPMLSDCTETG